MAYVEDHLVHCHHRSAKRLQFPYDTPTATLSVLHEEVPWRQQG